MSVGPNKPSESDDERPTELHFEEIEAVKIEPGDSSEPPDPDHTPADNEPVQLDPTQTTPESGYAQPASSAPQDARLAKAKHRWVMRAFFAGILVVIYFLLYWQHAKEP